MRQWAILIQLQAIALEEPRRINAVPIADHLVLLLRAAKD